MRGCEPSSSVCAKAKAAASSGGGEGSTASGGAERPRSSKRCMSASGDRSHTRQSRLRSFSAPLKARNVGVAKRRTRAELSQIGR